jgi:hypothetical protein
MLGGVKGGFAKGVKSLDDLAKQLVGKLRFNKFKIRLQGRRIKLLGHINPWIVVMDGELKGELREISDEAAKSLKIGDEGMVEIGGQLVKGRLVSHKGSEAMMKFQATNSDQMTEFLRKNVQGLADEQAKFLLEEVHKRGGTVVFGGSRVRGAAQVDDLGRVVSDLDVGFKDLTQGNINKIMNNFNKNFTGSSQGPNRIIEHNWIYPGSKPRSVPEILSPEEFFSRVGIRADGRNIGKDFGPSGYIKVSSDGSIEVFKP